MFLAPSQYILFRRGEQKADVWTHLHAAGGLQPGPGPLPPVIPASGGSAHAQRPPAVGPGSHTSRQVVGRASTAVIPARGGSAHAQRLSAVRPDVGTSRLIVSRIVGPVA